MLKTNKILFVIGSLEYGGAEIHLLTLLPELKKKGYDVHLLTLSDKGELRKEFLNKKINLILPFFKKLERNGFHKLFRIFNLIFAFFYIFIFSIKNKKALLHFFLPSSYIIGSLAGILTGHKKMIMSRRSLNNYQNKKLWFFRSLEIFLHKYMHAILGNSKKVIEQLYDEENVNKKKLNLIYNGINLKLYSKKKSKISRLSFNISDDKVIIINTANLISYKGHLDLLEACAKIKVDNWALLIIGEDRENLKENLMKFVIDNNLSNHIHFLGKRSDVIDVLSICDIGILCSHQEGFSNAILEYMASSLPVVATNVGGNKESVFNGQNGFVVELGQIQKITECLETLILNKHKRKEFGLKSIKIIEENFVLDKKIKQYDKLYKKILNS